MLADGSLPRQPGAAVQVSLGKDLPREASRQKPGLLLRSLN